MAGLVLLVAGSLFFSGSKDGPVGPLIFTQIPAGIGSDDWIFPRNARIVSADLKNSGESFHVLTEEFWSARAPQISFDGSKMIFSGRQSENSTWQIWQMDLRNREVHQVTRDTFNCTDPAYLPDGRVVFSRAFEDPVSGWGYALYTCNLDGTSLRRITFQPHTDHAPVVMQDGRILAVSRQNFPEPNKPRIMAMRPDGTKAELYYRTDPGVIMNSRGYELEDGRFIFLERTEKNIESLVAISKNRPLNSRQVLSVNAGQNKFYSAYPVSEDRLIVSMSSVESESYGLYYFDLIGNKVGSEIFSNAEYHFLEPVIVEGRQRPRILPTRVDESFNTGKLLCLDAGLTGLGQSLDIHSIRVLSTDRLLGEIIPENDGSFYVEVESDVPIRFQAIDRDGEVLQNPSSWVWVRPNENGGCIGCHENRELAPQNKVPDAIRRGPVYLEEKLLALEKTTDE